jgi:hypothetical protein
MTEPVQPWMHDRPVRNLNPGDLRPRHAPPQWPGQDGIDGAAGGPFSIFLTAADGWAALGLWCLDARYLRGLTTAVQMVSVFAPPAENDTESYAAGVANKVGHDALDLSVPATLEALCRAIAHYEEWRPVWTNAEIASGMKLCVARWPSYRAARLGTQPPAAPATETA